MDPFSVTVGVVGLLQAVTKCLGLAKKHFGPSSYSHSELDELKSTLYQLHGAVGTFQLHIQLYDDEEEDCNASLEALRPVVERSNEALKIVKQYLSAGRTNKLFGGAKFDKQIRTALKNLDESRRLFNEAVTTDLQTIQLKVRNYVQVISDDIKDIEASNQIQRKDQLHTLVISWLGAQGDNDMNSRIHESNVSNRFPGSGNSLLDSQVCLDWLSISGDESRSRLWLRAPPGTGKSFLCSTMIEHVTKGLGCTALYQFCRFDDRFHGSGTDDPSGLVRATSLLVHQLFQHFWREDHKIVTPVAEYIRAADKTMAHLVEVTRLILKHGVQRARVGDGGSTDEQSRLFLFLDGIETFDDKSRNKILEIATLFDGLKDLGVIPKVWISSQETYPLVEGLGQWPSLNADEITLDEVKRFLEASVPKLSSQFEETQEVEGEPIDQWVLGKLQAKAKGNFLYAKLMVDWLKEDVFTIDDIMTLLTSKVPDKLAEIYKQIFLKYQRDQYRYVSLLFSLVAFARRPLRLLELREAITLALSEPEKGLDPLKAPMALSRLFAPLIETQHDSAEPVNPFCRLCHSTVRAFLVENPEILGTGPPGQPRQDRHSISSSRIGTLFLDYLSLERYSNLLEITNDDDHQPLLQSSNGSRDHILLSYSAKFWVRHLDDLKPITPKLHDRLVRFLQSPNFQTLLQAKSLLVPEAFTLFKWTGKTDKFKATRALYRPVFPRWYRTLDSAMFDEKQCQDCESRFLDYRHFINEWAYLLCRSGCQLGPGCLMRTDLHFFGEVDRCLSGMLGPTNFMNTMRERYPSFMLHTGAFEYHKSTKTIVSESLSVADRRFTIMGFSSQDKHHISIDVWDLGNHDKPAVTSKAIHIPDDHESSSSTAPAASRVFASASPDIAADFYIGQNNSNSERQDLVILEPPRPMRNLESLSTDVDSRGDITVVASRNVHKPVKSPKVTKENIDDSDSGYSDPETSDSSDEESSLSSSDEFSAYETWSEGSTDVESDIASEISADQDEREESAGSESETSPEPPDMSSEDSESEAEETYKKLRQRMKLPRGMAPPAAYELELEEEAGSRKKNNRPTWPGRPDRLREAGDRLTADVVAYKMTDGKSIPIFHLRRDVSTMLYSSPPVLHPHQSLFVWPLGSGEVLFVDYEQKSYFIRTTTPTTPATRNICMRVNFSPCGGYLHIASVEARVASPDSMKGNPVTKNKETASPKSPKSTKTKPKAKTEMVLSLFVATHRLSSRKPTHSPPKLIHKAKLTFGRFVGFSLARLPFTFTWTPTHLYFAISDYRLNMSRVRLFPLNNPGLQGLVLSVSSVSGSTDTALAAKPRLPVMLPLSATGRQVYYLPPTASQPTGAELQGRPVPINQGSRGIVVLGAYAMKGGELVELERPDAPASPSASWSKREGQKESPKDKDHTKEHEEKEEDDSRNEEKQSVLNYASPPAGFYVDEEKDLGGWVAVPEGKSADKDDTITRVIIEDMDDRLASRSGRLGRKIEVFNWGDDVDLEGICDWCGRPVVFINGSSSL